MLLIPQLTVAHVVIHLVTRVTYTETLKTLGLGKSQKKVFKGLLI